MKKGPQNMYSSKQRWKIVLLVFALAVVIGSLVVSNIMVSKIANKEKAKATQWAQAIQKKVALVKFTNETFNSLRERERQRIQLFVDAQKVVMNPSELNMNQDIDFALNIIKSNTDIPVILIDKERTEVSQFININPGLDSAFFKQTKAALDTQLLDLAQSWRQENRFFDVEVYDGFVISCVYDESNRLKFLEKQRDSILNAFNQDLITDTRLMPVLLVDESQNEIIASNLKDTKSNPKNTIETFRAYNAPIKIDIGAKNTQWLFYDQSDEVKQIQWFPYIQFAMIAILALIGYLVFSTFRRAEQNQVWAGMAKETAHQLGTPLSSLFAWIDVLESQNIDESTIQEMKKDLFRLNKVTDRFSKIGSETKLENKDLVVTAGDILEYLKVRLSDKVVIQLSVQDESPVFVPHNPPLMEWVIENITKNAVDAMEGKGQFSVTIHKSGNFIHVDLQDTGKGLTPQQFKSIFQPGFSTKKRGWGLGLSLAKRIVEDYHKGKIFVLKSEINKGTTFRISLPL